MKYLIIGMSFAFLSGCMTSTYSNQEACDGVAVSVIGVPIWRQEQCESSVTTDGSISTANDYPVKMPNGSGAQ